MLAASGVDTYIQSLNAQKPWYPSRALAPVWEGYTRGNREFFRGQYPPVDATHFPSEKLAACLEENMALLNRHLDLLENGVDWIEEISKACRHNKITPWISIRMNDAHGAGNWEASYMNCDLQKDSRYRLSGEVPGLCGEISPSLQLLNYECPEVRDYYFSMIRELVEEYDYEGLELDWLRGPFCCEPPATKSTLDIMTNWISQVRELTERKARQNDRPFPLGLRIPVRLDALKTIGLDVQTLAREGLIDFIAPSNFWQTTWDVPYEKLRAAVGDEVAIYGVVEDAPNWLNCSISPRLTDIHTEFDKSQSSHRCLSASAEFLRGNAAGKLAQGVDGIYAYNFFCTDELIHNPTPGKIHANYSALRNLDNIETLRGEPKQYALSTAADSREHPFFEFADQLPVTIEPGEQRTFILSMCAERDPSASGESLELWVQIVSEQCLSKSLLSVSFNGCLPKCSAKVTDELLFPTGIFTHHAPGHEALNFQFPVCQIKEGWNELRVYSRNVGAIQTEPNRVLSVELAVKCKF